MRVYCPDRLAEVAPRRQARSFACLSIVLARPIVLFLALWCLSGLELWAAPKARTGAQIYRSDCARCHGPQGEGVADRHDEPLYGDRSVEALTRLIARTMPEDSDKKCSLEDAAKVAAYIYDAFYSPAARARHQPPRIQLARLTVGQYLNAAADLVGSFRSGPALEQARGLSGQYYNSRNFQKDKMAFERIDSRVDLDLADGSPAADTNQIGVQEFSIRWRGCVLAEETGDYEFCLKTENGARLWINGDNKALIDAWVSSGAAVRQERATLRLLGGRAYPLQLDFFKFKDKTASLVLRWKPPHKTWETIPERNLAPVRAAETMVVTTAFPADDSSLGYERGTAVSKGWDQAATSAAIEVTGKVVEQLESLSGVKADASDRGERLRRFCEQFAERAFRRPLTPEQKRLFVEQHFHGTNDLEGAVKRSLLLVLKSPRFLYPHLASGAGAPDDYDVASRLSFGLWDSLPDEALLEAASQGRLRTAEQIEAQALRMVGDPRSRSKLRDFFHHWLEMDQAEDLSKDTQAFPDFDEVVLSDLRTSLELFIDDVVWSEKSDYRQLLLADYLLLNGRLARLYGAEFPPPSRPRVSKVLENGTRPARAVRAPVRAARSPAPEEDKRGLVAGEAARRSGGGDAEAEAGFQKVQFDPKQRTGVITHPYLLSVFAYHKSSSPIHRGVFLTRNIVGRALKPPPMAIEFMDGRFDPSLTMREKVTELTRPAACQNCHSVINPLGFSLEHYDAVGRYRMTDNRKPVNAAGKYTTSDGKTVRLKGARDVARYAATSREAHLGFIQQLFHHVAKQPAAAYGPDTLEQLRRSFAASQFNIQKLLEAIVKITVLHGIQESNT